MASSYAPNESTSKITLEKTWLQGAFLSNAFFGIQTTLAIMTFVVVLRKRSPNTKRTRIILLVYVTVLFAVTLAAQGLLLQFIQTGFITQRDYPGGPNAFLSDQWATPINLASNVLVIFASWMMESLLVWRCRLICSAGEQSRWWRLSVAIPAFLLVAVFVTGSLFIHCSLHSTPPTVFILAYGLSSLALNIITTGFITARLLFYRRNIIKHLGPGHGQYYVGTAAVVVESAAIYTGFLIAVIVAYAIGSPATNLLQQVIEQVQTISSLLIILRIARGEGWSQSSSTQMVSAITSSSDTRAVRQAETNIIRLGPISTRPDEEEGSVRRGEWLAGGKEEMKFQKRAVMGNMEASRI